MITKNKNFIYLLFMLLFVVAHTQTAQAFDLFELPEEDLMNKYFFDPLFGDNSILGPLFAILNGGVLSLGGVLFMYNMIIMTERSAAKADKLVNSRWYFIRLPIAVALMLPIHNGFSGVQTIVVWSAKQGVGLATQVYNAVAITSFESALYIPPKLTSKVEKVAYGMFINNVCINAFNKAMLNVEAPNLMFKTEINKLGLMAPNSVNNNYFSSIDYSFKNKQMNSYYNSNSMYQPYFCGRAVQNLNKNVSAKKLMQTEAGKMLNVDAALTKLTPTQTNEFITLQNSMFTLSQSFINGNETESSVYKQIQTAANTYQTNMSTAAQAAFLSSVNPDYIKNMMKDGIIMFGAYPNQISAAADQVTTALNNLPTVSSPKLDGIPEFSKRVVSEAIVDIETAEKYAKNGEMSSKSGVQNIGDAKANSTVAGTLIAWFTQDNNLGIGNDEGAIASKNLLLSVKTEGNKLINAAWASFAAATGFAVAGGAASSNLIATVVGADGGFQSLMQMLTPVFMAIFFSLIGAGITLAVVIPLMVFITWGMAIIHYVLEVCLAVCAAPFWALSHTMDKGDGLVGTATKGYTELLSLVSRPSLMVMGGVFSMKLLSAANAYFNEGFAAVFNLSVMSDTGGTGITLFCGGIIVYSLTMLALTKKLISCITMFPDKFMTWIGGATGDMSTPVKDIGASTAIAAGATVGAMKVGNGSNLANAVKSMGGGNKTKPKSPVKTPDFTDNNSSPGKESNAEPNKSEFKHLKDLNRDN
ncbi:DotA/TraY family protein [Salmonella enterica]|nr:DotA/TraY family protein [Citrobacter freundii]EBH7428839.1 hypothetical protein [Salmonella enterica]EDL4582068.1 hypothetical protein [Salmonella enterica subsp. enterica serovar Infantis]EDM0804783.1 hypothetical protein [Salmonella enterica subsp. enterica serovar Schwarzengrund]EDZ1660452.1 DotA/TraY family protein [Salmonella enterica]EHY9995467.1 DotA/TraY family protein [Salmonella enterica]